MRAAVGVVHQTAKVRVGVALQRHLKGGNGIRGHEGVGQGPSYNLMRPRVGDEVQVHHAVVRVYVSDVGDSKLVWSGGTDILGQVLVFVVVMVGICRMAPATGLKHETVPVDYAIEPVASRHGLTEDVLQYYEHLVGAYAGGLGAQLADLLHYLELRHLKPIAPLPADRVITFASLAKQPAQTADARLSVSEPKVVYCLAPAFFSKSIP